MHAKKRKFPFGILLSVLVLAVVALVGTAVAKYVYSEPLTVRVQFEAKLADTVALLESKAERQPDGSRHPFDSFIVAKTPAERWGDPEDLMGAAVFFASSASDFVNGHILYVDGGILAYIGKQP